MTEDAAYRLDQVLQDWHRWAQGFQMVATHGACAMFTSVKSSRQWDSENEAVDSSLHNSEMKCVDFHIGELEPLHRTAIGINARNLVTGRSVWTSARLPTDIEQRQLILRDAREKLTKHLTNDGIL